MSNEIKSRLAFTVENFNLLVQSLIFDQSKHLDLKKDWRHLISSQFVLTDAQISFLQNLHYKSIKTIQRAFVSIIENGGKIYLERNLETNTIDVICENIRIFKPAINIKVCKFDGFFRRCKWFPRETEET